ncbi:MAG: fructosamine-3-kinase [Planctomycetota bacterium]|jgi:fructosamine-3-kinase
MNPNLDDTILELMGEKPTTTYDLEGGCVGDVKRIRFEDDRTFVVKLDPAGTGGLEVEGRMLTYLSDHSQLPVPKVIEAKPHILIMSDLGGSTGARGPAQIEAAEAISALHHVRGEQYGLEFDTPIGGLIQDNRQTSSWAEFFRDQRLLAMADQALQSGMLPLELYNRIKNFAEDVEDDLVDPNPPTLIHGDVWAGNILAKPKKLFGFVDPAIYYADPEIELAFINLFSTFSAKFFDVYRSTHELHDDFFDRRQHVYNLYPLLVHVRLFGGGYVEQLSNHLEQLSF